jgi:hypothetical protein
MHSLAGCFFNGTFTAKLLLAGSAFRESQSLLSQATNDQAGTAYGADGRPCAGLCPGGPAQPGLAGSKRMRPSQPVTPVRLACAC